MDAVPRRQQKATPQQTIQKTVLRRNLVDVWTEEAKLRIRAAMKM